MHSALLNHVGHSALRVIAGSSSSSTLVDLLFAQTTLIIHSGAGPFLYTEFRFFCLFVGYVDLQHLIVN